MKIFSGIEDNRKQSLKAKAIALNMQFEEEDSFGLLNLVSEFSLFKKGRRKRISNILSQDKGKYKIYIFDYTFLQGSGNNTRRRRQTVLFIDSKNLGLPPFSMKPERLWHRVANWLGFTDDINFNDHPKFSSNYQLNSEEEEIIRYYFNEDVLNFFSVNNNWFLEGLNYHLIFYSLKERLHPNVIPTFYNTGNKLFELFKTHPDVLDLDKPL